MFTELAGLDADRFVDKPPTHLLCSICSGVLFQPLQAPCQHVFCGSCIRGWVRQANNNSASCPVCRMPIRGESQLHTANLTVRNILNDLNVRCAHKDCPHVATMESLAQHEQSCGFAPTKCPNRGCTMGNITRNQLLRHRDECGWAQVACPNSCGQQVLRKDIQDHRETTCTGEIQPCEICSEVVRRSERVAHERTVVHKLAVLTQSVVVLQRTVEGQNTEIVQLRAQLHATRLITDTKMQPNTLDCVEFVVRGVSARWAAPNGFEENSPVLTFHGANNPRLRYSFIVNVRANTQNAIGHVGLFLMPQPGENPSALDWPIANHIQLSVVGVAGGFVKSAVCSDARFQEFFNRLAPPQRNNTQTLGFPRLLSQAELFSFQYLMNDCLVVRVALLPHRFGGQN